MHLPTQTCCLSALILLELSYFSSSLGLWGERAAFLGTRAHFSSRHFFDSILGHRAPDASHTLSISQPRLYARENKNSNERKVSQDRHCKMLMN